MKKIAFFTTLLFLFVLTPTFAILEGEVLWTTVEGEPIRIISTNDTKAQALRCLELYKYCYFNPDNSLDMMKRPSYLYFLQSRLERLGQSITLPIRIGYSYKLRWINAYQSFAFLEYDHDLGSLITIVSRDIIFRIFFTDVPPSVLAKTTKDIVDKPKLEFLFDGMLEGEFGK